MMLLSMIVAVGGGIWSALGILDWLTNGVPVDPMGIALFLLGIGWISFNAMRGVE